MGEYGDNITEAKSANSISIAIGEKLNQLPRRLSESYIFKVNHQLRMENEKAYDPIMVSIGPYHHDKTKSNLQYMEMQKWCYLNQMIERIEAKTGTPKSEQLDRYIEALKELEDKVRKYYAEDITGLKQDELLEMMLVDGCFIIEWCRSTLPGKVERKSPVDMHWAVGTLVQDLLLLENQIPFFVLEKLFGMSKDEEKNSLGITLLATACLPVRSSILTSTRAIQADKVVESITNIAKRLRDVKHLLDLVRQFMLMEDTVKLTQQIEDDRTTRFRSNLAMLGTGARPPAKILAQKKYTYSATELRDRGVTFEGVEGRKFYDITFEKGNGVLKIPIVLIEDVTEALLRNLIAYEEHVDDDNVKYVTDYKSFMNGLINSPKDVQILRRKGIIYNHLGDDEAVSVMFKTMSHGTMMTSKSYYAEIVDDLTEFGRKRRNVWMRKLRRDYFGSPWSILSFIAAFLLLSFTISQTVYTILTYYRGK